MSLQIEGEATATEDVDVDVSPPPAREREPLVLAPEQENGPPESPALPDGVERLRNGWSAIAEDLKAGRESAPNPGLMPDETRNAMIRAAGLNPDDFGPPRPLAELPHINNPEVQGIGYDESALRSTVDRMSDPERLTFTALSTGRDKLAVQEAANALRRQRIELDKASLNFPDVEPLQIS